MSDSTYEPSKKWALYLPTLENLFLGFHPYWEVNTNDEYLEMQRDMRKGNVKMAELLS